MKIRRFLMSLLNDELEIFGTELEVDTLEIIRNNIPWKLDIFRGENLGYENQMNITSKCGL